MDVAEPRSKALSESATLYIGVRVPQCSQFLVYLQKDSSRNGKTDKQTAAHITYISKAFTGLYRSSRSPKIVPHHFKLYILDIYCRCPRKPAKSNQIPKCAIYMMYYNCMTKISRSMMSFVSLEIVSESSFCISLGQYKIFTERTKGLIERIQV